MNDSSEGIEVVRELGRADIFRTALMALRATCILILFRHPWIFWPAVILEMAIILLAVSAGVEAGAWPWGWSAFVLAMPAAIVVLVPLSGAVGAIRAVFVSKRSGWISGDRRCVAMVWERDQDWLAYNFYAWRPLRGEGKPFLKALLAMADEKKVVVRAVAASMKLYWERYQPEGFVIERPGKRPKIRRDPKVLPRGT